MKTRSCVRRPAWWRLYGIAAVLIAGMAVIEGYVPDDGLRGALEVATVVVAFALMAVWLRRNRVALDIERARRKWTA